MASFTRADYKRIFNFAARVWLATDSPDTEAEAVAIMDLCEEVLGQQSNRPDRSA